MSSRKAYKIDFEGLKLGLHEYHYHLDDKFFSRHPYGIIEKADVNVQLDLDKQKGAFNLVFHIEGSVNRPCDRCLEEIDIKIDKEYELIVRLGEGEDDADVVYIPANSHELDVEQYLYEFTSMSVPMQVNCSEYTEHDCPPHIMDMIILSDDDVEQPSEDSSSPFKEAFKDLKLDEDIK